MSTSVEDRPPLPSGGALDTVVLPSGLHLERDAAIAPCRIGIEWVGNPAGPTIVALGGISADGHVCSHEARPEPGWWEPMVGPDRPLDTNRLRVVGMDWVGGPGRSSSPPRPGTPNGIPAVTTGDQAAALAAALDAQGVDRVEAVIGASYGAMAALAFGARYPERVGRIIAISGAHESHPMATALRALQRRIVLLAQELGGSEQGLVLARALAMTTYRTVDEFRERFPMTPSHLEGRYRFPVESYLEEQGRRFAARFDPHHFLVLAQSLDLHRVDPVEIRVPTTLLAVEEDTLVPLWQMRELAERIGDRCELVAIRSRCGHDAFLVEVEAVGEILRRSISSPTLVAGSRAHVR